MNNRTNKYYDDAFGAERKITAFDIAKLLGVDTTVLSFGPPDEQIIFERIVEQLNKVSYIPFPVSISTVDIALIRRNGHKVEICLGRKKNNTLFQFLGGFRDPGELSKTAAARETKEECGLDISETYFYSSSEFIIDDSRYREKVHKITTNFYIVNVDYGDSFRAKGMDDIEEVKWFPYTDLSDDKFLKIVVPTHWHLMEKCLSIC